MPDPFDLLRTNLREMLPPDAFNYIPKSQCLAELRRLSGEDFGEDVNAWLNWLNQYAEGLRKRVQEEVEEERRGRGK
jgi:hypothetical protein